MRVKCEVCQAIAFVKELPTHACVCGATEWIRTHGPELSNEEITDPCPKCGTQLEAQPRGGVKCPNCSYWFCF